MNIGPFCNSKPAKALVDQLSLGLPVHPYCNTQAFEQRKVPNELFYIVLVFEPLTSAHESQLVP